MCKVLALAECETGIALGQYLCLEVPLSFIV